MSLKIIGLGFMLNKNAYLRDGWNILDFIIVITAWLPHLFGGNNSSFSSLRVLRVLRPLRTISSIKSLRIILTSLFSAMRLLLDSIIVLLFFFLIFAIGGLQLFMGMLKRKCFNSSLGVAYSPDQFCSATEQCQIFNEQNKQYICGKMIQNANYGIINFDTIGWSFLQVFQCVTLEGWSITMRMIQNAFSVILQQFQSNQYYSFIYFIVLVFVGTFFLINLNLAIIRTKYDEASKNVTGQPEVIFKKEGKEDAHDLKKFKEWGIYISSRQKLDYKASKKQIQLPSIQYLLMSNQKSINSLNDADYNLKKVDQTEKQYYDQQQYSINKLNSGQNLEIDKSSNRQLIFTENTQRLNSSSIITLTKNIPTPFTSPAKSTLKLNKVQPYQGLPLQNYRLQSIQEERPKRITLPNTKETEQEQSKKMGQNIKLNNFQNINFAGMVLQQKVTPRKIDDFMNQKESQESDQSFSFSEERDKFEESEDMDQEDEFIQEIKIGIRNKGVMPVKQLQSNKINILQLKSLKEPVLPQITPQKDIDFSVTSSQSNKSQRQKNHLTQSSNDQCSFDGLNPSKFKQKNVEFLEDEDFGIKRQVVSKSTLSFQPFERQQSKIRLEPKKILIIQNKQNRRQTVFKRRETINMDSNSNILSNINLNDENMDEQEQIQKYKALYIPEYMIARVNFDTVNYQLNEDEVPYDSINEVLPSLKEKAQRIIQEELKNKLYNKMFKINYTFKDRKALKKIESNQPQKQYKIQKTQESKKMTNYISKKRQAFNQSSIQNRFRQIFDITVWKNSSIENIMQNKFDQKFNPKKFNIMHQLNYFLPESSVNQQKQGLTIFQKKGKRRKKNENKQDNAIQTYPEELVQVRNKFYPTGVFSLKDFMDQKNIKKIQLQTQEENAPKPEIQNPQLNQKQNQKPNQTIQQDSETDEESFLGCQEEYNLRIQKTIIQREDEYNVTHMRLPWSGEEVMQEINTQYFLLDLKSLVMFNRILTAYNWQKEQIEMWEGGLQGLYLALRRQVKNFALGKWFETLIMSSVLINTIVLSLDGIVSLESSQTLDQFNLAFTYIFSIDMSLKMFGMGVSEYLKDKMNAFDAIIVSLSLVELFFFGGGNSAISAFRSVRIFRIFRVLRVTRLIRQLNYMQVIIEVVSKSLEDFMYIFMLLILFNYIYALLGMQLYGGSFNFSNPPRMNFDDFFSAYMTVFDLLTIENWNDILTSTLRTDVNYAITLLYLISWIFIGNYVLLNLFLAILLSGFDDETDDNQILENNIEIAPDLAFDHGPALISTSFQQQSQNPTKQSNTSEIKERKEEEQIHSGQMQTKKNIFIWFDEIQCQKSFFLFTQSNSFRKLAYWIVKHKSFETIILIAIVVSSLKLVVDTYMNPDDPSQENLITISIVADRFFSFFFAAEMLLKSTALGFVWDYNSYLRESWSQLDCFIVLASLIDSFVSVDLGFVKILRLLRTLRPLRFISHNKNMKTVVTALLESVGGILNVLLVVILIWIMFGIFGMSLMQGKVHYCQLPLSDKSGDYYGVGFKQCLKRQGTWNNQDINFDDIFQSIVTLFVLSTLEGWPNYVFNFVDADKFSDDGENLGPEENSSKLFMLYFMVFIFVGSMFLINLFIGVVQLNYQLAHKAAKSKFLSEQQTKWIEVQRLITESKLDYASIKPPENYFRQKIWYFCQGSILETVVMICIILNIVTMAMAYETSTKEFDIVLLDINLGFTFVFMAECVLKLLGYGFFGYFYSGWNRFDFFVICTSLLDIILDQLGSSTISFLKVGPQLGRIFRVLRVSRLLRLIKQFQSLQKLILVAVYALPPLMNVTALLMLAFFIFAILGSFLFGNIQSGDIIDEQMNFSNFHHAILLLFVCSTGENWYMVMFDTMKQVSGYSVWFFIFFVVLVQIIMINLFILIILSQFEENFINENNPLTQFQEMEQQFKELWVKYTRDQNGTKIHEKKLLSFYYDLQHPLGLDGKQQLIDFINQCKEKRVIDVDGEIKIRQQTKSKLKRQGAKQLMKMNIYPDSNGFLYYNELLFYFYKNYMQVNIDRIEPSKEKVKEQAYEILEDEQKITKRKLDRIKQQYNQSIQIRQVTSPANPMEKILFINMCLKTWLKYKIFYYKKLKFSTQVQGDVNQDVEFTSTSDSESETKENENSKILNIIKREKEQEIIEKRKTKITLQYKNFCKVPDATIYKQESIDFFPTIQQEELNTPIYSKNQRQSVKKRKSSVSSSQLALKSSSLGRASQAITPSPLFQTQQNDSGSENETKFQTNIINLNIQNNYIINNNYYFDSKENNTNNIGEGVHMIQNINIPDSQIRATTINIQNNIIQDPGKIIIEQPILQASVKSIK